MKSAFGVDHEVSKSRKQKPDKPAAAMALGGVAAVEGGMLANDLGHHNNRVGRINAYNALRHKDSAEFFARADIEHNAKKYSMKPKSQQTSAVVPWTGHEGPNKPSWSPNTQKYIRYAMERQTRAGKQLKSGAKLVRNGRIAIGAGIGGVALGLARQAKKTRDFKRESVGKSAFGVDHIVKGLPRAMRGLAPADLRGVPRLMVQNQQIGRTAARAKAIKGEPFRQTQTTRRLREVRYFLGKEDPRPVPRAPLP